MEKDDKGSTMIRMGVRGWMFLLVPAYPGCPGSKAVKRSLLLLLCDSATVVLTRCFKLLSFFTIITYISAIAFIICFAERNGRRLLYSRSRANSLHLSYTRNILCFVYWLAHRYHSVSTGRHAHKAMHSEVGNVADESAMWDLRHYRSYCDIFRELNNRALKIHRRS